jgi:hypothetical protein
MTYFVQSTKYTVVVVSPVDWDLDAGLSKSDDALRLLRTRTYVVDQKKKPPVCEFASGWIRRRRVRGSLSLNGTMGQDNRTKARPTHHRAHNPLSASGKLPFRTFQWGEEERERTWN